MIDQVPQTMTAPRAALSAAPRLGEANLACQESCKHLTSIGQCVLQTASWPSRSMCGKERGVHHPPPPPPPPVPTKTTASHPGLHHPQLFQARGELQGSVHYTPRCWAWHGGGVVCWHAMHEHVRIAQGRSPGDTANQLVSRVPVPQC